MPRAVLAVLMTGLCVAACNRKTAASADSAAPTTPSTSFDEAAARAQIVAADSAFVRAIVAKNVDSLMYYYDPSVVSLGKIAVKGTTDLRKSYEVVVRNPPTEINFQSGGVNFSDDHTMAWDYGTVSQTATVKGKSARTSGTYLNVWKNVGGRWKIVAEISSTS